VGFFRGLEVCLMALEKKTPARSPRTWNQTFRDAKVDLATKFGRYGYFANDGNYVKIDRKDYKEYLKNPSKYENLDEADIQYDFLGNTFGIDNNSHSMGADGTIRWVWDKPHMEQISPTRTGRERYPPPHYAHTRKRR
jgi:hypothetical protein